MSRRYDGRVVISRIGDFSRHDQADFDYFFAGLRRDHPWAYWALKVGDINMGVRGMQIVDAVAWQLGLGEDEPLDPKLLWVLSFLMDYFTPENFFTLVPPVVAAARMMPGSLGDNLYYMLGIGSDRQRGKSSSKKKKRAGSR